VFKERYNFFQVSPTEWRYEIKAPERTYNASYEVLPTGFIREVFLINGVLQFEREFDLLKGTKPTVAEIIEKNGDWP
jgi:hypothetical protein